MSKKKMIETFKLQRMVILIIFGAFVLLAIIFAIVNSWRSGQNQANLAEIESLNTQIAEMEAAAHEAAQERPWNLQLINRGYPLAEDFEPSLSDVAPGFAMDSRVASEASNLLQAAEAAGVPLTITAAFRNYQDQRELFLGRMTEINAQGINMFDAYNQTALNIAIPGTSELQAGLALEFGLGEGSASENFASSPEMEWLIANARTYGFILRFPEDKTAITGMDFQPGHWRYVGVEAATTIAQQNTTLEEYLLAN